MEAEKLTGDLTPDKIEETIENPEEEETPEEEPQETEQEPVKEPEKTSAEIEEANKKLYARMKKAEEGEKAAKEELEKSKKPITETGQPDSLGLAKTVAALKEFNELELDDIALIAKAKVIPLEEAAQTEEAKNLVAARRLKVAKELKAPLPSSSLAVGKSEKDIRTMSSEEHRELEEKVKKKTRRQME